MRLINT